MAIAARRQHGERGERGAAELLKSRGYRPPWDSNGTPPANISETSLTRATIAFRPS